MDKFKYGFHEGTNVSNMNIYWFLRYKYLNKNIFLLGEIDLYRPLNLTLSDNT